MILSTHLADELVALPVFGSLSLLDPEQLGPMATAAEAALLRAGESENTLRSYKSALRYWAAWFALRYQQTISLPVSEPTVVQFIVDHALRPGADGTLISELPPDVDGALVTNGFKGKLGAPSLNTLVHRVSVLSKLHKMEAQANPCEQPRVRELLAKARRGYAKRDSLPNKKAALTREPLEALLATCDNSLAGKRDSALLLFAFSSGGRRRSEVVSATMENTRRAGGGFVFSLAHSKANQGAKDRPENEKPILGRASAALQAWLEASQIKTGPIFRRVRSGGVIGKPLSPAAVRDIVKRRCGLAGLDVSYSAHSLRSGFVTEAGIQRIPLGETMALTGHRTTASLVGYFRGQVESSPGASLMDDPCRPGPTAI